MAVNTRKKLEIQQRRKTVMANVLAGGTYREISEKIGVSLGTISGDMKAIMKDLQKHYQKDADEWRTIQLRRTDVMLNAIWDNVRMGSLTHIDRALRIIERQDKYLGISDAVEIDQHIEIFWHDPLGDDDVIGAGADELPADIT